MRWPGPMHRRGPGSNGTEQGRLGRGTANQRGESGLAARWAAVARTEDVAPKHVLASSLACYWLRGLRQGLSLTGPLSCSIRRG